MIFLTVLAVGEAVLSISTIKLVVGALCSVIVFMSGGFIYIFKKLEKEVETLKGSNFKSNQLIQKYSIALAKSELRYNELFKDYEHLKLEHEDCKSKISKDKE